MSDSDFIDDRVLEAQHRASNDLQLVAGLLRMVERRIADPDARAELSDVAARVQIIARARRAVLRPGARDLGMVLRDVCEALEALAAPRGIAIELRIDRPAPRLPEALSIAIALAVNELVANALKYAFDGHWAGCVTIAVERTAGRGLSITVDDDGAPMARGNGAPSPGGVGLDLARRLIEGHGGALIMPAPHSKRFELRFAALNCAAEPHDAYLTLP